MEERRVFSASDLAQFEYCPLAWWYEENSETAQADEDELAERLEELKDQYGTKADALPEYQVIERLLERAQRFAQGRAQHAKHVAQQTGQSNSASVAPPVPRIFGCIVAALVVLTLGALGLGVLLWVR
jgi:hypothetical protein